MLSRIKKALTDPFFPNKCQACGLFFHARKTDRADKSLTNKSHHAPMETIFSRVMVPFLCPDCRKEFSAIQSPICTQCGRMFKSRTGTDHQCEDCIKKKKYAHCIRSAGIYAGPLMSLIHALKYHGKLQLARPMGELLFYAYLKYYDINNIDLIIPIPLHISRLKQRGFNQAMMLLKKWQELIHETHEIKSEIFIDDQNLFRCRKTVSQTGLGRKKRKQNVKNAFTVANPSEILKKRILLIDDVYTTGATAEECAKTLIKNGAETVSVLTLARTG